MKMLEMMHCDINTIFYPTHTLKSMHHIVTFYAYAPTQIIES